MLYQRNTKYAAVSAVWRSLRQKGKKKGKGFWICAKMDGKEMLMEKHTSFQTLISAGTLENGPVHPPKKGPISNPALGFTSSSNPRNPQVSPNKRVQEMKRLGLTMLLVSCATNAFEVKIPASQKILGVAPEVDLNRDGVITDDELKTARDKLPENLRAIVDSYLGPHGDLNGAPEPATPKTTLPKPPASTGTTPFIDPIFKIEKIENITYATVPCGDTTSPLPLDIYRPSGDGRLPRKLPAVIFCFGGGWRKGSENVKYIRELCEYYAERGYVAFAIQYRIAKDDPPAMPGPAPSPDKNEQSRLINAAFQDTCNAVRWVRMNAGKYNIDPNRIAIGGVSAGAVNALHVALCDEGIRGPDAKVAAAISFMGATSAAFIDKDDPPVFIAHGTKDNVAPYVIVRKMVQQLEKVNAQYSFYPVDGVAHRLQSILDAKFDGKSIIAHSVDFCFVALNLGELLREHGVGNPPIRSPR